MRMLQTDHLISRLGMLCSCCCFPAGAGPEGLSKLKGHAFFKGMGEALK